MNRMTWIAAALAASLAGAAMAETPPRQINVTGEGRVEAVPDMATITLGVTNEAEAADAAMAATSQAVSQVLERLSGMGIEARDMQTQRLSLNPVWTNPDRARPERRTITGFVASNTVMVRVRDLDALGGLLDAVIADGANDFNGLSFSVQEPEPLMKEARKAAVADAMEKARELAQAAGVTLGPVQSISEQGGGRPRPMGMEMAAARDASVPVAAGEVTIEASVSMVFAIGDGE